MKRYLLPALAVCVLSESPLYAQSLAISIGIRETGPPAAVAPVAFENGGSAGGIEWVNLDGQSLVLDGTWQLFTFTPATDTLTAFAGATANGALEPGLEWGTLEHIRIRNIDGITTPITLWVDDLTNTALAGTTVFDYEASALGTEDVFQEPGFSGSTMGNVVDPATTTSLVSDSMAFSGTKSDQIDFQFIDDLDTRWVRLTTFGTPNNPNPLIRVDETASDPTFSFYLKGVTIPEPSTFALTGLALVGVICVGLRRAG